MALAFQMFEIKRSILQNHPQGLKNKLSEEKKLTCRPIGSVPPMMMMPISCLPIIPKVDQKRPAVLDHDPGRANPAKTGRKQVAGCESERLVIG
jgi:hypothetical protein